MYKKIKLIIMILLLISCKNEHAIYSSEIIELSLSQVIDESHTFDKINYTDFIVYSYKKKYPNLYKQKLKEFTGIPKLDSFLIVSRYFQIEPHSANIKKYQNDSVKNHSDSRMKKLTSSRFELNAVSGFIQNKHIVIPDANNNNDFSDDVILEFEKTFKTSHNYNPNVINKLQIVSFNHQLLENGEYHFVERKIQIFPYENNPYEDYLLDGILDKSLNKYTLMLRLKDVRKGRFNISDVNYTVAVQGLNNSRSLIVIKPDSIDSKLAKENFEYKLNDTIILNNELYVLSKLSGNFKNLEIKKIVENVSSNDFIGHRIGNKIRNYNLTNLNNRKINFSEIVSKDKYFTLLDFWGTWCGPCKKMTPDLKILQSKYSDKLNIIGVALDNDINEVKDYISENNIDWLQTYVDRNNRKNSIIQHLKIKSYPTYILINNEGKILYRGGSNSLDEIRNILKKNQV